MGTHLHIYLVDFTPLPTIHPLYTPCTPTVHPLYIHCTPSVHSLYTHCTSTVHPLHTHCTPTDPVLDACAFGLSCVRIADLRQHLGSLLGIFSPGNLISAIKWDDVESTIEWGTISWKCIRMILGQRVEGVRRGVDCWGVIGWRLVGEFNRELLHGDV